MLVEGLGGWDARCLVRRGAGTMGDMPARRVWRARVERMMSFAGGRDMCCRAMCGVDVLQGLGALDVNASFTIVVWDLGDLSSCAL